MADVKDRDKKPDGRTEPYTWSNPRPKAEIVAEAYTIEEPTPTQEECDNAKLAATNQTPPEPPPEGAVLNPPAGQQQRRAVEANQPGGYQTRSTEQRTDKKE